MRHLILGCLTLALAGGCGGAPAIPAKTQAESKEAEPAGPKAKPDVTYTMKEFETLNSEQLRSNRGKTVAVTGKVYHFDNWPLLGVPMGQPGVQLRDNVDTAGGFFTTSDKQPWKIAAAGQTITVVGICEGGDIRNCRIENVTGASNSPDRPVWSADEVLAEITSEDARKDKKYNDQWLLMSGEIAKMGSSEQFYSVKTKATPTYPLTFHFQDDMKIAPGTKVLVCFKMGYPALDLLLLTAKRLE